MYLKYKIVFIDPDFHLRICHKEYHKFGKGHIFKDVSHRVIYRRKIWKPPKCPVKHAVIAKYSVPIR